MRGSIEETVEVQAIHNSHALKPTLLDGSFCADAVRNSGDSMCDDKVSFFTRGMTCGNLNPRAKPWIKLENSNHTICSKLGGKQKTEETEEKGKSILIRSRWINLCCATGRLHPPAILLPSSNVK